MLRLSAVAGGICGVAIAAGGLGEILNDGKTAPTEFLNGLSPAFGLAFLVGLYLAQRTAVGTFGTVAFMVNYIGLALFAGAAFARNFVLVHLPKSQVEELLEGRPLIAFLIAALLTLTGTVLFGLAMYRAGVVPRPAVLLYVVGFAPVCLSFLLPVLAVRTGHMVAGAGILWLSLAIWSLHSVPAPRHTAAPAAR
ncbi:hypothetical protein [Actinomadura sp. 9N407]|uniref:hypothetical protein n=1 Tax=Actinomadura sp. 9N407 TaxID=3375154 RepID=UPI003797A1B9